MELALEFQSEEKKGFAKCKTITGSYLDGRESNSTTGKGSPFITLPCCQGSESGLLYYFYFY
jgi:hypothetical protein